MKKFFLYAAGVFGVLFAGAAIVLYLKLGVLVKTLIETLGPKVTGTEVRVTSVRLSPFSGSGRVKGIFIGNPSGFKTPSAFELKDVRVAVDMKSVAAGSPVIKEIIVTGPEVTYEAALSGSNLAKLQKNVESFVPASAPAPADKKGKSEMKVIVDLFKVTGGKVNLSVQGLGKSLSVPLPDVELRGIGRKTGGVTAAEAAKQMFGAVMSASTKAAAGAGDLLKGGAKTLEETGKKATDLVNGLFGKKKK